jgi:predicted porin
MKKLLLATLVSAVSMSAAYADGPTVYGKLNVSVDSVKSDLNTKSTIAVDSNASRFGVKGSEKLTDKLSAVYGIEWGVVIDNNSTNSTTDATLGSTGGKASNGGTTTTELNARNRYIGLQYEGVGALKIGRLDTFVRTSQNGVDIFDDYVNGNMDMSQTFAGENRVNNVIAFESTKFDLSGLGGLQANFMVMPNDTSVAKTTGKGSGTNGLSTSLIYTNKDAGLYASIAGDHNVTSTWAAFGTFNAVPTGLVVKNNTNIIRGVGKLDFTTLGLEGFSLNGLVQQATIADSAGFTGDPKETSYLVGAVYKFPASVLDGLSAKVQWQSATTKNITATSEDVKIDQLGFDVDYAFSAKTKVYGFYAKRNLKNPNNPASAANGVDQDFAYSAFGLGLEQKF